MTSQNNTGRQFDKTHAVTVVAQAAIAAYRFVTYEGKQAIATTASAKAYVQGVSEEAAAQGEALSVVTGYSYLVQAAASGIAVGDFLKPDADGKAVVGDATHHCGKALGTTAAIGDLVEVQILPHVNAA